MIETILTAIGIYLAAGTGWVLLLFWFDVIEPGEEPPIVCWAALSVLWPFLAYELFFVDPMKSRDGPTLDA